MKCPCCKREFKTPGAYSQHMKSHVRRREAVGVEKTRPEPGHVTKYAWSSPIVYMKSK